jgi:hypothetical protein
MVFHWKALLPFRGGLVIDLLDEGVHLARIHIITAQLGSYRSGMHSRRVSQASHKLQGTGRPKFVPRQTSPKRISRLA